MKTTAFSLFLTIIVFVAGCNQKQVNEPWSEKQLLPPEELANILNGTENSGLYLYNLGPSGSIKNAIDIGEGKEKKNIEKLKSELSKLPNDAFVVIYCGCCPFKDCPNVRPAFRLLNEMGFSNQRLLDIQENLKVNWIDKGYPMKK